VIRSNVERIADTTRLDPANAERLATMRAAAERGATLTTSLLAFARRQPLSPRLVDLNAAINGMRTFLHSSVGAKVGLDIRPAPPDLWPAMIDPTQLELLVLNLVTNARDAMPDGGPVTIATANVHRGPPQDAEEPAEGDYVVLTARDTGIGMAPEVQAQVFEPFFTTKPPGTGSGLGLSQVFGTARQSGGGVQLESAPGKGTAVSVYLPRAVVPATTVAAAPPATVEPETQAAVLLVVDDDPGYWPSPPMSFRGRVIRYCRRRAATRRSACSRATRRSICC
jgi:signal transduction histidine kinase